MYELQHASSRSIAMEIENEEESGRVRLDTKYMCCIVLEIFEFL